MRHFLQPDFLEASGPSSPLLILSLYDTVHVCRGPGLLSRDKWWPPRLKNVLYFYANYAMCINNDDDDDDSDDDPGWAWPACKTSNSSFFLSDQRALRWGVALPRWSRDLNFVESLPGQTGETLSSPYTVMNSQVSITLGGVPWWLAETVQIRLSKVLENLLTVESWKNNCLILGCEAIKNK